MPIKPPTARIANPKTPQRPGSTGGPHGGFAKIKDATARLYDCAPWRKFKALVLGLNPVCQRLEAGEQCTQAAAVVHHIVSPRVDPAKFLQWQNVLCVCAGHHMPSKGEPLNSTNRYALTHGLFGETFDPNEVIAKLSPVGKPRLTTTDGRAPAELALLLPKQVA